MLEKGGEKLVGKGPLLDEIKKRKKKKKKQTKKRKQRGGENNKNWLSKKIIKNIKHSISGNEGEKNEKLALAITNSESDYTLPEYFSEMIKDTMWLVSTDMLFGSNNKWKKPKNWKDKISKQLLEEIKNTNYQYVSEGINDPNICLKEIINSLGIELLPGLNNLNSFKNKVKSIFNSSNDDKIPDHKNKNSENYDPLS